MSTRIRELRERLDLNQDQLGQRVGVTRQTIAAWEGGQRDPSITQFTRLALELRVPVEVLFPADISSTKTAVHLLFRADNANVLSETDQDLLTRRASDYAFIERLVGLLPLIPEARPLIDYEEDAVEQVARETRDWLGVADAPLGDVFALIERKGLKVIRERLPSRVWGFSAYTEEWGGVIFVNTRAEGREIPTERQYFTALHELGHLIFHRREYTQPSPPVGKKDPREAAADHFAGAVLLPAAALKAELRQYRGRWLPEPLLIDIKKRYGVSVGTILFRAAQLGIITPKQRGQQFGMLKKAYPDNFSEPPVSIPDPVGLHRLQRLVYGALVTEKITESKAAEILQCSLSEIRDELVNWLQGEEDDAI